MSDLRARLEDVIREAEERYCELIAKRLDQMCFNFEEPA